MQSSYCEVLRCLLEGLQWLKEPAQALRIAGSSGISQARTRLGWEPLRQLHDEVLRLIAQANTRRAWYRQWRVMNAARRQIWCARRSTDLLMGHFAVRILMHEAALAADIDPDRLSFVLAVRVGLMVWVRFTSRRACGSTSRRQTRTSGVGLSRWPTTASTPSPI